MKKIASLVLAISAASVAVGSVAGSALSDSCAPAVSAPATEAEILVVLLAFLGGYVISAYGAYMLYTRHKRKKDRHEGVSPAVKAGFIAPKKE